MDFEGIGEINQSETTRKSQGCPSASKSDYSACYLIGENQMQNSVSRNNSREEMSLNRKLPDQNAPSVQNLNN